jgi:hemerythrin
MIDLLKNCPASVGIAWLDEQHLELHRLLWGVLKILETDPSGALAGDRFIQLADQTSEHYRTEEGFLQTMGYPDLVAHRLDHERILERFKENLAQWNDQGAPPLVDIVEAFSESTQSHLKTVDRAFVEWLEEQGGQSFPSPD